MASGMKWNGDRVMAQIAGASADGLRLAALYLHTQLRTALSKSYPPASSPGQYPHGRTWNLRDNVVWHPQTREEVERQGSVRVGYTRNAFYGLLLETRMHRKGLLAKLDELMPQLAVLAGKGQPA